MAARSDAQTLVALRFVDCPHAANRLEQKVAKDKTEGVEFTPEGDTSVKQDDFHSLDFRCKIDDLDLPARLVNLPTIVETHKTWDRETYVKCGDVGQILLVFKDESSRTQDKARQAAHAGSAWSLVHPDGLTPPLQDVVRRRFSKARKRSRKDVTIEEVRRAEDLLVELRNNDNEVTEETICEDVVRFEDWMIDANGKGREFREDGLRDSERAWMFLSSSDLKGIRTTPVLMPGKPAVQGPDLTTLAGVTAYRTKVAERHSKLAQDVAVMKRTAAAAGGQVPEAAQRDLLKKEEQRKKLGITMARLDQKILEFTAQAAGEQLPASAAASPKAPPGAGKRISLKLPGAAAPPAAAPGTGKRLSLKLPTRPAEPVVEAAPMDVAPAPAGQGKRLSLKLPTRPADEAPPTAAPMDVEPPAAPRTGKRLSLKLPARLADQPPPPPSPPPPSSNAMSDD